MAAASDLHIIQPIPYFPVLRPQPSWALEGDRRQGDVSISHAPMFYLPKILKSLDGHWLYRAVRSQLTHLNESVGLDIIDAHFGYPEGVGAVKIGKRLGLPVSVTLRGFEAEYLERPIVASQIRQMFAEADLLICVGHFLRELAVRHGASPDKIRVIHNAIDRTTYFPGSKEDARLALGLPVDVPVVLSVGHLVVRKRHHVLIDAFAGFRERFPDARLLIIGASAVEPEYPELLKSRIEKHGLEESVVLLGNLPTGVVADYYRAADLFALGTQREGCCNAILEALASGLPVVTTPAGDNASFVRDGENGFIIPIDDAVAMESAMVRTFESANWSSQRISGGLGVGDWSSVASDVLHAFDELVSRRQYAA